MDRTHARRILAAAFGLGIAAELLLDGHAVGLNVPILVVLTLGAAWLVRRPGRAPDPLDAWLPVSAVVLAAFVAVRADPFLASLDTLGAVGFTGATMAAWSGLAVTRRAIGVIVAMGVWAFGATMLGAIPVLRASRPHEAIPRRGPAWTGGVLRGLALGIPLALIFAVLFASADPIFRRGLDELLGFSIDLGTLPGRVLFVIGCAWFLAGLLSVVADGIPGVEAASLGAAARTTPAPIERMLGATEAIVVLGVVVAVVGAFVGLQVAYLFGGLDTLAAVGMTYSDYARRGYFELVAAAGLAGGLLVVLELAIRSRPIAYRVLATALVGLTLVVLGSAALRLQLYQDAYGWTELRLYVAVSIAAMAVTLVVLAVLLLRERMQWLGHAMAGIGLGSLIVLNLLAPAAFVAERNLARAIDPSLVPPDGHVALDYPYLGALPDDAIPAIIAALPSLSGDDRTWLEQELAWRRSDLAADDRVWTLQAWNLGRERAKAALGLTSAAP